MSAIEQYFPDDDRNDIEREFDRSLDREIAEEPVRIPGDITPREVRNVYDHEDGTMLYTLGGLLGAIATIAVVKRITKKE